MEMAAQGSSNEQTDEVIRGIRQGGERTVLSAIENLLRIVSQAAERASGAATDSQTRIYMKGKSRAFSEAADLIETTIKTV